MPLTGRKGRAPDQVASAGATPGKKRRVPSWVDVVGSPIRKQKSDTTGAPATPSASGKPGRPKTPGRPRATAAGSASPVMKGAAGSRELRNLDRGAPSARPEPDGRKEAKTPSTVGRKLLKRAILRSASDTPQAGKIGHPRPSGITDLHAVHHRRNSTYTWLLQLRTGFQCPARHCFMLRQGLMLSTCCLQEARQSAGKGLRWISLPALVDKALQGAALRR